MVGGIGSMNSIMSSNVMSGGRARASSGSGSVGEARNFVNTNQINPLIGGGAAAAAAAAAAGASSTGAPISDVGNGAAGVAAPTPGALGGTTSVPGRGYVIGADFTQEDRKAKVKTHDLCVWDFGLTDLVLFVGRV